MLNKEMGRLKRHGRIRKKIFGTAERPRLSVHRSLKNLYVQAVDDMQGRTLCSLSSTDKELGKPEAKGKVGMSQKLGKTLAKKLIEKGIKKLAFDRGGYQYHGRVKALAESLREAGIEV